MIKSIFKRSKIYSNKARILARILEKILERILEKILMPPG
jgi:hypothetical protein